MHSEIISQRDRRRFPRRALETPAKLTFEDGTSQQVSLKDLSATGSRIGNLTQTLTIQPKVSKAQLSLNIPKLSIHSDFPSRIAWAHDNQMGLCFEENTLQPKIVNYILEQPNDIKAFSFEVTVYLKDTNAFGNAYFSRYFDWQGMTREAFLKFLLGDPTPLITSGIKMITVRAHIEYYHETFLYDQVVIKVHSENMKHATFDIVFNYYNRLTSQLIATGRQTIAFAGAKGNLVAVPAALHQTLKAYERIVL